MCLVYVGVRRWHERPRQEDEVWTCVPEAVLDEIKKTIGKQRVIDFIE